MTEIDRDQGRSAVPVPPPMTFRAPARDGPWDRLAIPIGHPAAPVPSAALPCPRLSRAMLGHGVALRRERLAELEARMVDACDAAAVRGDPGASTPGDRRRWDRAAWQRYLDAATRLERSYGPRMRRLRDDIVRLERLLDLPLAG